MCFIDKQGAAVPNGWTDLGSDVLARRVTYSDFRKLHINARKVVMLSVFRKDTAGGPTAQPFRDDIDGNDAYSCEHDAVNSCLRVCKHTPAGGGAGSVRIDFIESGAGGGAVSENWPKDTGNVPMLGVAWQDAAPSTAKTNKALATQSGDVTMG